jgi:hypothetical protein
MGSAEALVTDRNNLAAAIKRGNRHNLGSSPRSIASFFGAAEENLIYNSNNNRLVELFDVLQDNPCRGKRWRG